ncbi:MAG TPA: RsmE family RNA methyltransferase [Dehalococcoidia bacterium]|nr:RsmE family RNA methyltransferase [Dehalococcoidia bacterium]
MRIPRLYVPELNRTVVGLDAGSARRLKKVLRMSDGDRVTLFDGKGLEADAVLVEDGRQVSISALRQVEESGPVIHLYPALIRANRFDWVVEKAVELGARSIRPVVCERSLIDEAGDRSERWRRLVIEAAEQSGRKLLPEVHPPQRFETAIAEAAGGVILAWEGEKLATLREAVQDASELSLFAGPEGGYSDAEVEMGKRAGATLVTLGPYTLRAETAAIILLGASKLLA